MATLQDLEAGLDAANTKLDKVLAEVTAYKANAGATIAALQSAVTALELELATAGTIPDTVAAKLAAVNEKAASLDALIDDLPAPG